MMAPEKRRKLSTREAAREVQSVQSSWDFGFKETKVFNGSDIPSAFESKIYHQPNNTNFAAINSFAVDSDGALFFFK